MNASYLRSWVPEELQPIRLEELAPRVYIPRSPSQPRGRADAGRRHRGRGDGAEPRPGVLRNRGPRWDRGSRRESRRPASNRFNVSYYTDPTHLLREELDAVSVCVPTQHHAKVAL